LLALASLKQNDKATSTSEKKHAATPGPPLTPLQRMVKGDEGPPRLDGSDKYFGFDNVVKNGLQDDEVSYISHPAATAAAHLSLFPSKR